MSSTQTDSRRRLVNAVIPVYHEHREEIEQKKREQAHWDSTDFIWEALLASAATMGSARGYELIRDPNLHDPVRYAALRALSSDEQRQTVLGDCLAKAHVRFAEQKTERLMANFRRIESDGGPEAIKRELNSRSGSAGKIEFLRTFKGIGEKYARNMMMDVYHEDFRDSIAVDARLKKVMSAVGLTFSAKDYDEAESFFLEAAHEAGLSGWELDRLLFFHLDEVLNSI